MEQTLNDKILKISGGAYIPPERELELGEDIDVDVHCSIIRIEERDNQNGTKDRIYYAKQVTAIIKE